MAEPKEEAGGKQTGGISEERRAWVRYATDLTASCHAEGSLKDAGWPAKVSDISAGGIGLLLRHRFQPGAPLVVELRSSDNQIQRLVQVRVRHARPVIAQGDQCWLVGCIFVPPLSEEEVQILAQ
jgi:PilZ domain